MQAMEEIVHAAHALDKRPDVKSLIITGEGAKYFAAGADIKEMADQTYDEVRVPPTTALPITTDIVPAKDTEPPLHQLWPGSLFCGCLRM